MNDTNTGSGNYGVSVDVNKKIAGFAWSPNSGWVCFGASCAYPSCNGMQAPDNASSTAYLDGSWVAHGWAKFCNLGDDGWISLNCANRAECGTSNYAVSYATSTGNAAGWAWHGRTPNGWGWMDFSAVKINIALVSQPEGPDPVRCRNGKDDDGNGLIDCFDPSCQGAEPACPNTETHCSLIGQTNCCANGVDDDFNGQTDCADPGCAADAACAPVDCTVGGAICSNPKCVNMPGCELCMNGAKEIATTSTQDCTNAMCATYYPGCTPAWFQSKYGNVYAQAGVTGTPPPPGMANATYCITSAGSIVQAKSETGCVEPSSSENVSLPTNGNGYASSLGRIDVAGILSGRYGTVKSTTNPNDTTLIETSPLAGKVFVYDGTATCPAGGYVVNAKTFFNASGQTAKGNGLLVVKGCDLKITGNMSYDVAGIGAGQYLRNLASFGILVLCRYSSGSCVAGTGNITIDPGVTNLVGTMYAERTISTGSTGNKNTDQPLQVFGALVAHQVKLQRLSSSPSTPAERVIFDGRSVVNPPPGYQDISKSLPAVGDKY